MNDTVIVANGLSKYFAQFKAVDNISFSVKRGICCGILGPNGAGKTTTLKMLVGNTLPSSGELHVLNWKIPEQAREMRYHIGIVPQKDNLDPDFSVTQNLHVYGSYFNVPANVLTERIPKILQFANLENKANALIHALSGGMQRRLSLGRALINDPQLLILDEPTTGLDPQARQLIWQRLRQLKMQGLSLILTTHYMEEAERLCDELIIMDNGKILAQASPRALIEQYIEPQVLEVHGAENEVQQWHTQIAQHANLRHEKIGDTWFYYGNSVETLVQSLQNFSLLRFLHRPANLEDVFLKLTGRDLREG